uniref:Uncharacterized protein n=1 Tax=Candidatus Kentrum sp. FW TaxID=2126338 RepID=A0A450TXZ8_9GAMM|nr:MAG: hypothetical protein BECKFW1821C_GA0114237_106124 [Candidatus Kentron sp. FW]
MGKGAVFGIPGHRGTIRRRAHRIPDHGSPDSPGSEGNHDGHGAGSDSAVFQAHHKAPLPILPPLPIRFGQSGDMPEGTLRAILKQAGISPEEFLAQK